LGDSQFKPKICSNYQATQSIFTLDVIRIQFFDLDHARELLLALYWAVIIRRPIAMTVTEKIADQHIREYESRLKHMDELFERAKQISARLDDDHALKSELAQYQEQHNDLVNQTAKPKNMPIARLSEDIIRSAGPMAVWDILAQKLENLIERIED
jgi:hypothetical protein